MNYSSPEERPVDVLPKLFVAFCGYLILIHRCGLFVIRSLKSVRENNNPSPTPCYIFLTNKLATTYQATDHDDASNNGVIPSHYERCRQTECQRTMSITRHDVGNNTWWRQQHVPSVTYDVMPTITHDLSINITKWTSLDKSSCYVPRYDHTPRTRLNFKGTNHTPIFTSHEHFPSNVPAILYMVASLFTS